MKVLAIFLAMIVAYVFAASTNEMLDSLDDLEEQTYDLAENEDASFIQFEQAPALLSAEQLRALIEDARSKISSVPATAIPSSVTNRISRVADKIFKLNEQLAEVNDIAKPQFNPEDTFKTPGDLLGNQTGISAHAADQLVNVMKFTQKHRKISKSEVEKNFDYADSKF
jgi:hypothetical protein